MSLPLVAASIAGAIAVAGVATILLMAKTNSFGLAQPSAQTASVTCTFGATGVDVQVQISEDPTPCATEEQALASDGLSWYPAGQLNPSGSAGTADGETMGVACELNGTADSSSLLIVMDAGGMSYGLQICSAQEQGGNWTAEANN